MHMSPVPPTKAFTPDGSNTRLLRDAFGRFATGVTIVTAMSDQGPVAITANSFSSVSLDPPLVLWSPDKNSRRFTYFVGAENYAIHVLAADQDELCWRVSSDAFGLREGDYLVNAQNVPILPDCLARFECSQRSVFEGGDHAIVVGEVLRATYQEARDALGFFGGKIGKFVAKEAS